MIDIFSQDDMCQLLKNKTVVFLGDSNIRALYKDFLCLLTNNQFISEKILRHKMENSCYGDKLVYHGQRTNGRDYREERSAKIKKTSMKFFFLTRVYDTYVEELLKDLSFDIPDVIVINSCLWDVTRWGPLGVEEYKKNLRTLMEELKNLIPDCLVIWVTTPPIAQDVKGGFLLQELQFLKYSLRFHVLEANHFARKVVVENGFDVLDTHYHLKLQIQRRCPDGIHWFSDTVRFITNLLLTHISLAWDVPLPHRYKSEAMEENLECAMNEEVPIVKKERVPIKYEETASSPETTQSNGKENLDSFVSKWTPKKKKNKSNRWTKNHERQTHHAYFSRQNYNERLKRVRRGAHASPGKFGTYGSNFSTDFTLRNMGPSYMDSVSKQSFEFSHPSNGFNPYDSGYSSPVQPSYDFHPNLPHTVSNFENYPTPSYRYQQPCSRRLVVYDNTIRQPYQFPPVPQNGRYQPDFNFTSDTVDGYYF